MPTKSRPLGSGRLSMGQIKVFGSVAESYYDESSGYQVTTSEGHSWPPSKAAKKQFANIGGNFATQKVQVIHKMATHRAATPPSPGSPPLYAFDGLLMPAAFHNMKFGTNTDTSFITLPSASDNNFMGVNAWSRFKPTSSSGSLGQAILELHDVKSLFTLPRLYQGVKFFKSLGSAYLQVEFGWKPFLNDIKEFAQNTLNADKRLRQLARDNGRIVRRRGNTGNAVNKTEITNSVNSNMFTYPGLPSPLLDGSPHTETVTRKIYDQWKFSGAFRYYIAMQRGNSLRESQQLTRIVYGLDLTPSTVYEVMPWSWMVDWFSNVGANIDNLNDSEDNLVALYAYIMNEKFIQTEVVCRGKTLGGPYQCSSTLINSMKSRSGASPFGFGLSPTGFTGKQTAILAALGATKIR